MGRGGYIPMQMPLARAEMFTPSYAVAIGPLVRLRARSRSLCSLRRAFPTRASVSGASGSGWDDLMASFASLEKGSGDK